MKAGMSERSVHDPDPAHRRNSPVQERSARTFERIVAAASQLLVEEGLAGFNTNAVARQAGVNVGTVYHYFGDKNALLTELFVRSEAERVGYVTGRLPSFVMTDDVAGWISETLGTLISMRARDPGASIVRSSLRVVPSLQELGAQFDARAAAELAAALRKRIRGLNRARAEVAARMIIDTGNAALDNLPSDRAGARALHRELSSMITAYVEALG